MKISKIAKELERRLDKLDEIIASVGAEVVSNKEILIIPKDKYIELLDLYDSLDDLKDRINFNS